LKSKRIATKVEGVNSTYEELNLKIQLDSVAGRAPDLAVQGLNTVIPMGDNAYVVNLAPYAARVKTFSPRVMPTRSAGVVNGRLVSIPWGVSVPVLWINTDLFRQAGINPTAKIRSWAELAAVARRLTNASSDQYGIAFGMSNGWIPLQFLLNSGSNLLDSKGNVAFNNAGGRRAIAFQNQLYRAGVAHPGNEEQVTQSFIGGKTAIFVATTSTLPAIQADAKFAWSALSFPPARSGAKLTLAAGGAGISMFAPRARRAAAFEVIKCLFDPKILRLVVKDLGYLPVRSDISNQLLAGVADKPPYTAALPVFRSLVPWYSFPGPNSIQALQIFVDSWTKAQKSSNPTADLNAAAKRIEPLLP
jgi:multiple sugar transport system substrate-binding protein